MQGAGTIIFPLIVLAVGAFVIMLALRQHRAYRSHLADIERINQENRELNRENHDLARQTLEAATENLAVLKQIRSLLEDRKA